jgi:hypothetical protein
MKYGIVNTLLLFLGLADSVAQTPQVQMQTSFRVRYVTEGSVYVEGGRNVGLSDGALLVIRAASSDKDKSPGADSDMGTIAQLRVFSVAETSAVCEVLSSSRPIVVGDIVTLPQDEVEKLVVKRTLSGTRQYPAVISFTEGDPMDEEVRDKIPRPSLPEVNQARGRVGFDFSTIQSGGVASASSIQVGTVLRADITRINGTYWNLNGYWRGQLRTSSTASTPTIQDLINRTYQFGLTYANPKSRWTFGLGRMYIPWAPSLQTIDGGYAGRKLSSNATAAIFAGLAPDPTAYNYNPNLRMGGGLINFAGGEFDSLRYSGTFGVGISTVVWSIDRPFVFAENSLTYKRAVSIYHSLQVDKPSTGAGVTPVGFGVKESYLSVRYQPVKRVSMDLNHSYFRDVPTYDPQLVGTGLLDKWLFQGISGGARIDLPAHVGLYTSVGRSSSSTDSKSSWNTMYGVTLGRIWKTGVRMDLRYTTFNSVYAQGSYRSILLSRSFSSNARLNVQAGRQSYNSSTTRDTGSSFVNFFVDTTFGPRYFVEGGFTLQRGALQNYNQIYTTFGYRFDNRRHGMNGGTNVTQK